MTTQFDQEWCTGTGTPLDDVLWPMVVTRCDNAKCGCTRAQHEAAWDAYCSYDYEEAELKKLATFIELAYDLGIDSVRIYDIIKYHEAVDGLVEAVDDAIALAGDADEDD